MTNKIKLEISKIKINKLTIKELKTKKIGFFYDGNNFSAFEMTCPHMGGDLCSGKININKKEIQCMVHGYIFSIISGKFLKNPNVENTLFARKQNKYYDPNFRESGSFSLTMLDYEKNEEFIIIDLL